MRPSYANARLSVQRRLAPTYVGSSVLSMILSLPHMKRRSRPISALNADKPDQVPVSIMTLICLVRSLVSWPSQPMQHYPKVSLCVKKMISNAIGSASFIAVQVDLSVQLLCHDHWEELGFKAQGIARSLAQPRLHERRQTNTETTLRRRIKRTNSVDMIIMRT